MLGKPELDSLQLLDGFIANLFNNNNNNNNNNLILILRAFSHGLTQLLRTRICSHILEYLPHCALIVGVFSSCFGFLCRHCYSFHKTMSRQTLLGLRPTSTRRRFASQKSGHPIGDFFSSNGQISLFLEL